MCSTSTDRARAQYMSSESARARALHILMQDAFDRGKLEATREQQQQVRGGAN